jgi:hypothetical protein
MINLGIIQQGFLKHNVPQELYYEIFKYINLLDIIKRKCPQDNKLLFLFFPQDVIFNEMYTILNKTASLCYICTNYCSALARCCECTDNICEPCEISCEACANLVVYCKNCINKCSDCKKMLCTYCVSRPCRLAGLTAAGSMMYSKTRLRRFDKQQSCLASWNHS